LAGLESGAHRFVAPAGTVPANAAEKFRSSR